MKTIPDKNDLTEGVIWKRLLAFFFPILLGMLFQQLYNTVDAIIVGKFVGTEALAAVGGSAAVLANLVIGFFVGLSSGASVVISQFFGAHNYERLSAAVHTTQAFCLITGAVLTVLCYVLAPWSLELVNTPQNIIDSSVSYVRIYFAGAAPMLLFNAGSGILRAVGDSKRPLYFLVICCVLNIVLDLLFVVGFKLGVSGAAWATFISQFVSAVLVTVCLCRSKGPHRLVIRNIRIDAESLRKILYIGVPSGVQSAMYSISNIIIQTAVNGLGIAVMAAWTACGKFDGIFWVTINAFGIAICAFVGQCYGAGMKQRSREGIRCCLFIALGVSAAMSALLLSLSGIGLQIISSDTEVIKLGVEMLWYFAPYYVLWVFIEIFSNALRGMGDAVNPMLISILGVCVLRILWVIFVIPSWHTVMGLSMVYPFTWAVTALVFAVYYRRYMKKKIAF